MLKSRGSRVVQRAFTICCRSNICDRKKERKEEDELGRAHVIEQL